MHTSAGTIYLPRGYVGRAAKASHYSQGGGWVGGVNSKLADKGSDSSPICKRRPGRSAERVNGASR